MNWPILWWTARSARAVRLTRIKPSFFSRLSGAAMAAAMAVSLTPVPVPAQNPPPSMAKTSPAPQIQVDASPLPRSTGAITSFAPIVDKVTPSVVTVFTTKELKENPLIRRFFGVPDESNGGGGKVEGLGSGVIVSTAFIIV